MSYRLEPHETLPASVRRIVDEQLADAVDGLRTATGDGRGKAVHEARKATKKSRAVLRLVRGEIGSKTYKRENGALRDAARRLSEPRDAAVLVATVERLGEQVPLARHALAPLRSVLEQRHCDTVARVLDADDAMTFAAEEIAAIRVRIGDWQLEDDGFATLEDGLRRSYSRGRDAVAKARSDPTDERLHDARKRVKDLWYHARVLKPIWPGPMGELVDALDRLGDLLGEDHDLAVLADTVRALAAEDGDAGGAETVLSIAANRRAGLRAEVWPLVRRVYADKPKPFVCRLRVLFDAWREETTLRTSAASAGTEPAAIAGSRAG